LSLLPARVSTPALHDFTALYVPRETPIGSSIEIKIRVSSVDISARDFGGYLSLTDRVYGRLSESGLRSYSQTPRKQLRISEIRSGSIEIVILELLSRFTDATPLVILWLFLKYLPTVVKGLPEGAKAAVDAYKTYQEAALIRENRKRLREEVKRDEVTQQLSTARLKQLVGLLDFLQEAEAKQLPASVRFAKEKVEAVELLIHQNESADNQSVDNQSPVISQQSCSTSIVQDDV
jgi:hypothetical protein